MSKRSQEKRRKRAKDKATQLRRERNQGPLARLAGGIEAKGIECWANEDMEQGIGSYTAFRPVHGGGWVMGGFLVDFDCLGLKDAFYRLDVSPREVMDNARRQFGDPGNLRRVDVMELRGIIAGAIRWTNEHGFRLPADTPRALKILGGELNIPDADIADFGDEDGHLHYIGRKRDLEKALREETLEEFTAREDVTCEFMDGAWNMLDKHAGYEDEEDEDEEMLDPGDSVVQVVAELKESLVRGTRHWCIKVGEKASDHLERAAEIRAVAVVETIRTAAEDLREEVEKTAARMLDSIEDPVEREQMKAAYGQIMRYLATLPPGTDAGTEDHLLDDGDEEYLDDDGMNEAVLALARKMTEAASRWCADSGQTPHPALQEAAEIHFTGAGEGLMVGEPEDEESRRKAETAISQLLELETPERRAELEEALKQLGAFISSFESGNAMADALELF